ncbi:hypothetical protein EIP86_010893 [Pleurotus ostreatoroseus]|nr:hypothetical protein EIP86_010893 [Pleurotus ostreatoroseus]
MHILSLTLSLSFILSSMSSVSAQQNILSSPARGLIYSATADFRHDSIPTAIQALKTQGTTYNITFDQTEDKGRFTDDQLAQYDVIVFLQNTGEGPSHPSTAMLPAQWHVFDEM